METQVRTPSQVFTQSQRLIVPLFQRPYVWSRESQWAPLWDDIARVAERYLAGAGNAEPHFLGAVVLQQVRNSTGSIQERIVIDGQQRLTTLQLLLDALHAELVAVAQTQAAARVESLVVNQEAFRSQPEDRFKVWPTNRDRPAFNAVMSAETPVRYDSLPDPSAKLVEAHRYFAAEIRAWLIANGAEHVEARALAIEKVARELLQIVVIDLTVDENAQEIFETLNARGTPLTAADLIKNFIFQRLMEGKENVEAIYERQWQDFETAFWETEISAGRIRHSRSSIFLGHFLIARTGEEIVDREVFTRFKRFADHEAGVPMAQLVTQLRRAATVYRSFIDLSSSTDEALGGLGLFAYRANVMESEVVKPLVMWLQDPEQAAIAEIQILESLAVVESWLVRRMLVRSTTKNYNQVFASLIMELGKNDRINVAQQIEEFFVHQQAESAYWPDDEEVRHELSTSPLYRRLQRPRLRMVLEAIEDHRRGWRGTVEGLGGQRARRSKYEIEHVMPQSWEQHWPAGPNPDNENERHQLIHTLGNLTLLTGKLNAKVSNGPWETKLAALREHDVLKLTQDVRIVGEDGWNGDVIRNRTAGMIDDIIAIWPVPAGHQSPTSTPSGQRKVAVTISDLINSGLLAAGATLTPRRKALRHRTAIVLADGRLEVDSVIYDSPSGAAKGITTKQENGWWFFLADAEHGVSLSDVLRQYIDFTSADADENSDETELSE